MFWGQSLALLGFLAGLTRSAMLWLQVLHGIKYFRQLLLGEIEDLSSFCTFGSSCAPPFELDVGGHECTYQGSRPLVVCWRVVSQPLLSFVLQSTSLIGLTLGLGLGGRSPGVPIPRYVLSFGDCFSISLAEGDEAFQAFVHSSGWHQNECCGLRAASIADLRSSGVTPLLKRAITVPSLPTRNFSKFHSTSPEGSI